MDLFVSYPAFNAIDLNYSSECHGFSRHSGGIAPLAGGIQSRHSRMRTGYGPGFFRRGITETAFSLNSMTLIRPFCKIINFVHLKPFVMLNGCCTKEESTQQTVMKKWRMYEPK